MTRLRAAWDRLRDSLLIRILALVIASLVVAQAINLAVLFTLRPPPPPLHPLSGIAAAVRDGTGQLPDGTPFLRSAIDQPPARAPSDAAAARLLEGELARQLGVAPPAVRILLDPVQHGRIVQIVQPAPDGRGSKVLEPALVGSFRVAVEDPADGWSLHSPPPPGMLDRWEQRMLLWFGAGLLLLVPLALLVSRRLAEPFRELAGAAERLGRDPQAPPLGIDGPVEVRRAADAFNEMQRRLRRYVEDRTHVVGAIAHDLRTPLTRLAFRIESVPEELRAPMTRDLAEMEAMVSATMGFVRGTSIAAERPRERLELASLVERVVEDMALTGRGVTFEGGDLLIVDGDPMALRRLLTNLIENALKFGQRARVRVLEEEGHARIEVDDDGPGLPAAEIEQVFEPFYRAERSRSRETGGIGLGLSVVRGIARSHGGDVTLANRPEGGLRALVLIPLATRRARRQDRTAA